MLRGQNACKGNTYNKQLSKRCQRRPRQARIQLLQGQRRERANAPSADGMPSADSPYCTARPSWSTRTRSARIACAHPRRCSRP
eukprot:6182890-Pleurochrysis_carterae.AAC.7